MTTASNSINTNSIERITSGILNIGGVATDVSLKNTTTQALTVTGRTTSEIQGERIEMSYVTYPTEISSQRAYQLFLDVFNGSVNNPLPSGSGTITTVTSNSSGPVLMTIPLPIGVWSVSYTVKFASANSVTPVTASYAMTTLTLDTPVTYNGVTYPKYLGLQAVPFTLQAPPSTSNYKLCMSGNTIITNNVANTLRLQVSVVYTAPNLRIIGRESSIPSTFMIATRIA